MCILTQRMLYIAWTEYQRRQVSMAPEIGFECIFLPVLSSNRLVKLLKYINNFALTIKLLWRQRPEFVWVQLPQVPLLWVSLFYKATQGNKVKVIADCHNAMFRKPWSRFPYGLSILHHCDCVLVHNDMVLQQAVEQCNAKTKILVLEDVPPLIEKSKDVPQPKCLFGSPRPWIVLPGSFADDEPVREVLEAATMVPEATFVLTGRLEKLRLHDIDPHQAPHNVVFTDYLSIDEYDSLLRHADAIVGLTKVEGVQLSVCNEAIGYGKPLIVANTQLLNDMFSSGAQLVDPFDPVSIATGIRNVLQKPEYFSKLSSDLSRRRRARWRETQLADVLSAIKNAVSVT